MADLDRAGHRAGEPEKFESFFRREFPVIVGLLVKAGYPRQVALDAVEEAMTRVCATWDRARLPVCQVARWVRCVALRRADVLARRHQGLPGAIAESSIPDPYSDPEPYDGTGRPAGRAGQLRLLPLLATLPDQQRLVMALHIDGWETGEIAELSGLQPESVRVHLRHGRQALKTVLSAFDPSKSWRGDGA